MNLDDEQPWEMKVKKKETYMEFVRRLTSDQHEVASKKLTPENVHLLHALIGISGETGEKWDNFKRFLFYGQEIDRENLMEELGDLLYYVGMALDWLGTDFETCMQQNMDKLNTRYASGKFSTDQAVDRADKQVSENQTDEIKAAIKEFFDSYSLDGGEPNSLGRPNIRKAMKKLKSYSPTQKKDPFEAEPAMGIGGPMPPLIDKEKIKIGPYISMMDTHTGKVFK